MRSLSLAVLVLLATTCVSHYVIADPLVVKTDTTAVEEEQEDIYITIKQKYIDMAAEFCDCDDTYEPLCAKDGGNYANDCVRNCAGIEKAYDGICESSCFPPGKRNCNGDWDGTMPVCVFGLTFTNLAEAQCSGRALPGSSPLCSAQGVCEYGVRDGEVVTVLTTDKPRPGVASVAQASVNTTMPDGSSPPPYNYAEALTKTMLFYDSLMSGNFSKDRRHLDWRDNSCFDCIGTYGEDLSGGYYEAGGTFMKATVLNTIAFNVLAWAGLEFPQGFNNTGNLDDLKYKVKWAGDYYMECHPEEEVAVAVLGNSTLDYDYIGPPELYEEYVEFRPAFYVTAEDPGAEIPAVLSAALSSAALLLQEDDPDWAEEALEHSVSLYNFAKKYPVSVRKNSNEEVNNYTGGSLESEMAWSAVWLYKATGNDTYLAEAQAYFDQMGGAIEFPPTFEAGKKDVAVAILLADITKDTAYVNYANTQFFDAYLNQNVQHTNAGAAHPYHWGGNRAPANLAFLTQVYAPIVVKITGDTAYAARLLNYGAHQANYLLGDAGRSWIVGFGGFGESNDNPAYIWHKASYYSIKTWDDSLGEHIFMTPIFGPWASNQKKPTVMKSKLLFESSRLPQAHIAYGTMFSSPLMDDSMVASRKDYSYTEPTLEYQAGLVGALAGMSEMYGLEEWEGDMIGVVYE